MKLSLKVEYACQVLAQLARSFDKTEMPHIEELSRLEGIPSNYLVQILNELRNGGLIVSRRGKQGGYRLSRSPAEISLHDIVCAVDGELLGFSLKSGGQSAAKVAEAWGQVAGVFEKETRAINLENLVEDSPEGMWYI